MLAEIPLNLTPNSHHTPVKPSQTQADPSNTRSKWGTCSWIAVNLLETRRAAVENTNRKDKDRESGGGSNSWLSREEKAFQSNASGEKLVTRWQTVQVFSQMFRLPTNRWEPGQGKEGHGLTTWSKLAFVLWNPRLGEWKQILKEESICPLWPLPPPWSGAGHENRDEKGSGGWKLAPRSGSHSQVGLRGICRLPSSAWHPLHTRWDSGGKLELTGCPVALWFLVFSLPL